MIYVFSLILVLFSIPAILQIWRGLRELRTQDRSQRDNLQSRVRILFNLPILLWVVIVFVVVVFAVQK